MTTDNSKKTSSLAAAVSKIKQKLDQHDAPPYTNNAHINNASSTTSTTSRHQQRASLLVTAVSNETSEENATGKEQQQQQQQQQVPMHCLPGHHQEQQRKTPPVKSSLARAIEAKKMKEKEEEKEEKQMTSCRQRPSSNNGNKQHKKASASPCNNVFSRTSRRKMNIRERGTNIEKKSNPTPSKGKVQHTTTTKRTNAYQKNIRSSPRPIHQSERIPHDFGSRDEMGNNHKTRQKFHPTRETNNEKGRTNQHGKVINVNASNRMIGNALGKRIPTRRSKGDELKSPVQTKHEESNKGEDIRNNDESHKPRLLSKAEVDMGNIVSSQVVSNWADESSDDDSSS